MILIIETIIADSRPHYIMLSRLIHTSFKANQESQDLDSVTAQKFPTPNS